MFPQICQVHKFSPAFFLLFSFLLLFLLFLRIFIYSKIHEIDSCRTFLPHLQNESSQSAREASINQYGDI